MSSMSALVQAAGFRVPCRFYDDAEAIIAVRNVVTLEEIGWLDCPVLPSIGGKIFLDSGVVYVVMAEPAPKVERGRVRAQILVRRL